jgi:hypothetical protein
METYGGIFTDKSFEFNAKCVFFGFALMLFYWITPDNKNIFMLPVIFIVAYILMAWYDWLYDCNAKMYTGQHTPVGVLDSIFKPQRRNESKTYPKDQSLLPDQEKAYLKTVYLFHLIAVVPLLTYIGIKGINSDPRVFPVILAVAGLAGVYHAVRLFLIPRETN